VSRLGRMLGVAGVCVAAGCAALPQSHLPGSAGSRTWDGRFAVTVVPGGQGQVQRSAGRFSLTSAAGDSELELISPLGATMAIARVDERGAALTTADGSHWQAGSAQDLTEQALGWRVPVDRLAHWLRGEVAHPARTEQGPDGSARVLEGEDAGWTVQIDRWDSQGPRHLILHWPARAALTPLTGCPPIDARCVSSGEGPTESIDLSVAIDNVYGS
jgi:outer membrane lipoprotein LolB